ncbi:MAG TPA: CBO0543 family protein [Desulfosporosinus sp.]|nr:CBO0543 family protein [Desulfosporosinus sp.]
MILLLACLFVLACYKWGDWRNWKIYYPTILFLIAGDFIHFYVAAAKPLWRCTAKVVPGTITTLIIALIIYPCTVLVFLPFYPKSGVIKKVCYITAWVCLYAFLEYLALKYNYMQHLNGWNFIYSVLFDYALFLLLLIHQKKPPGAWLLSSILGFGIAFLFKLPASY